MRSIDRQDEVKVTIATEVRNSFPQVMHVLYEVPESAAGSAAARVVRGFDSWEHRREHREHHKGRMLEAYTGACRTISLDWQGTLSVLASKRMTTWLLEFYTGATTNLRTLKPFWHCR